MTVVTPFAAVAAPLLNTQGDARLELEQSAAHHFVEAMESFGIRTAFGVPGGAVGTIFDELCRSTIEVVLTQHECSAAYAAMGRSMASNCRELAVCFSTSGPGMTNLVTGVAAAYAESVPLLVVTGNSSTQHRYTGALQDSYPGGIDALRMFDSITIANRTVYQATDLVPLFLQFAEASLRHKKPVHLNVPLDVSNALIRKTVLRCATAARGSLCNDDREQLTRFLSAKRPVIFIGNGVKLSGCGLKLADAANRHHLPVLCTTHGRGGVSENDPCFFGTFGFASDGIGRRFLESYAPDAILFLGTGLGEMATSGWSPLLAQPEVRIHVDIDTSKFNRAYEMTGVIENDLCTVLDEALKYRRRETSYPATARTSMIVPRLRQSDTTLEVHPRSVFVGLAARLPENAAIFAEMGNAMAWAFHDLALRDGCQLFVPLALASMGSAIGVSLGAATYWKDRCVVCICGDGAALMHGSELKTAAECGIPIKFIILNDGGLGMVHHGSRLIGLENTHVRFRHRVDFEGLGNALGIRSTTMRNEQEWHSEALEQALAHPGPALLDVWVDPAVEPPIGERARVLRQTETLTA